MEKEVLDPCCGSRMFWFDKQHPLALYADSREETHVLCDGRVLRVAPDLKTDFRAMPFADGAFRLVVFDPPHLVRAGASSWMAKKYGVLSRQTWRGDLAAGFAECWRVLATGGTLIFKWNEDQIPLRDVLACFGQTPLFGQTTTHNRKTVWCVFYKPIEK